MTQTTEKTNPAKYEIFLRNGSSFILEDVTDFRLSFDSEKREITNLNIVGSKVRDKLIHIDIKEIVAVIKRSEVIPEDNPKKESWWKRNW